MQMLPFVQGLGSQSSMLVLQFIPVKPSTQLQVKELTSSVQVPLFIQGLGSQSSMLVVQLPIMKEYPQNYPLLSDNSVGG